MTVIRIVRNRRGEVGNLAPVWDSDVDQDLFVGVPFSLDLDDICTDPEGDPISYEQVSGTLPPGLSLAGSVISGTPTTEGDYPVTFDATDFHPLDVTFIAEGSGTEWVTFGHTFLEGQVDSGLSVAVQTNAGADVAHQCDIRAAHDDGSVRHAIITAQVTGGTTYRLGSIGASGNALTVSDLLAAVAGDIASVTLTGGVSGTATVRDLLESATNRAKINNTSSYLILEQGPRMLGVVVAQDFDTHLRVSMHLRWYGGTLLWCDYCIENGYGNLAGGNSRSYTAAFALNGVAAGSSQAFSSPAHYNRAMWHRAHWSSGGTLYAKLSASALMASKAFPLYDDSETPSASLLNGAIQSCAPMTNGDFSDNIGSGGAHDWIGLLPRWDAVYFTSDCDERAYNWMLANADAAMSMQHSVLMDSVTGESMSISDRTTIVTQNGEGTGLGSGWATGISPFGNTQTGSPATHAPSASYTAYIVTGMWSHMRSMTHWAAGIPAWTPNNRNFTFNSATVRRFHWSGTIRAVAWSYRSCGQAAYILPDSHYLKTYFANLVNGNFSEDADEYIDNPEYPLGTLPEINGDTEYKTFMHAHLCAAVGYLICDLGFTAGQAFAEHITTLIAGLLGVTGEYCWNFATGEDREVGATDSDTRYTSFAQMNTDTENVPAYAQLLTPGTQAMADAMFSNGDAPSAVAGTLTGNVTSATGYPANYRQAVAYFAALGITGATTCMSRLNGGLQPDYSDEPQFNILPR